LSTFVTPEEYLELERKAEHKSECHRGEKFAMAGATRAHNNTYPDVTVVCGDRHFADEHADTLLNPTFIAEVLSPSSEGYDRGRKFEHYRNIESLAEYLLVAQDRIHVDVYTRQADGRWVLSEASRLEDTIEVRSIGCRLALADLYEKVDLAGPADSPPPGSSRP
jgi:Uma2 family endonuclease